jgi:hypothetical protein
MKTNFLRKIFCSSIISFLLLNQNVLAGSVSLRTGPQQLGNGGSYPLFIPPASHQMALTWVTDSGFESTLSLYPGLLFGK